LRTPKRTAKVRFTADQRHVVSFDRPLGPHFFAVITLLFFRRTAK
jgi:hypothetical protein